jgi:hypothetical protein
MSAPHKGSAAVTTSAQSQSARTIDFSALFASKALPTGLLLLQCSGVPRAQMYRQIAVPALMLMSAQTFCPH